MTHLQKVRMARGMRTRAEIGHALDSDGRDQHEGIFTSKGWEARKKAISARVASRVAVSQQKAEARRVARAGKPQGILTRVQARLVAMRQASQDRKRARQARYDAKHSTA